MGGAGEGYLIVVSGDHYCGGGRPVGVGQRGAEGV